MKWAPSLFNGLKFAIIMIQFRVYRRAPFFAGYKFRKFLDFAVICENGFIEIQLAVYSSVMHVGGGGVHVARWGNLFVHRKIT